MDSEIRLTHIAGTGVSGSQNANLLRGGSREGTIFFAARSSSIVASRPRLYDFGTRLSRSGTSIMGVKH